MKILYIGGVKSGKSRLASQRALAMAMDSKPIYLATTDSNDSSMRDRIAAHQKERGDAFETLEEPLDLTRIHTCASDVILIDCLTLWISNMLYHGREIEAMKAMLDSLLESDRHLLFILNDVGSGIHAESALGRKFTDISGLISQHVARACDEVYHCIAGIGTQIK